MKGSLKILNININSLSVLKFKFEPSSEILCDNNKGMTQS